MPLNYAENVLSDIFRFVPVFLVPLLKRGDLAARNLDVQFDVLSKARISEVRGSNERKPAEDSLAS